MKKNYCIREDYIIRNNIQKDGAGGDDKYQNDVYLFALDVMKKNKLTKISDIGCGLAYKFLKYFSNYNLIGYEIEPILTSLKQKYPKNKWVLSDFNSTPDFTDLVICADVIEHVDDPDELMEFIKKMRPKHLIISTPDRNILHKKHNRPLQGPPASKYHIREWTFEEFNEYISQHFKVISHKKNNSECGQVIHGITQ